MDSQIIYNVIRNKTYGRYMVANRFIKQGELILKETPLIVTPQIERTHICFRCCTCMPKNLFEVCETCKTAFICKPNCTGVFHTDKECVELSKLKLDSTLLKMNYQVITPMRMLLFRNYSITTWQEITELESHLEARRNSPIWKRNQIFVENILKETNILSEEDIKKETMQQICGVLDVNAFEMRPPRSQFKTIMNPELHCLRGLYPTAAIMAHDCVSNTHLAVDDDFTMYVHASVNIEQGSQIFVNYSDVLQGTMERKNNLKEGKYFACTCKRCLDPSELNTHISSLKCHKCQKGTIEPEILDDKHNTWCCTACKRIFSNLLIESTLWQIRNLIEDTDPSDIIKLEKLHTKLRQTLHRHHYLMLWLEKNLAELYKCEIPNRKNLLRKIDLCENLLQVCQILEPGISRIQGVTLYELHAAIANLAHTEYSQKKISLEILLQQLKSSETTLRAALKHLVYEPMKSPEGELVKNALGYLKILRKSISDIEVQLALVPQPRKLTETKKKKY